MGNGRMVIENGRAVLEEHSGAGLEAARLRAALATAQQEKAEALALLGKMREALEPFAWWSTRYPDSRAGAVLPPVHTPDTPRMADSFRAAAALSTPAPAALEEMRERVRAEIAKALPEALLSALGEGVSERGGYFDTAPQYDEDGNDVDPNPLVINLDAHGLDLRDVSEATIRAMKEGKDDQSR